MKTSTYIYDGSVTNQLFDDMREVLYVTPSKYITSLDTRLHSLYTLCTTC